MGSSPCPAQANRHKRTHELFEGRLHLHRESASPVAVECHPSKADRQPLHASIRNMRNTPSAMRERNRWPGEDGAVAENGSYVGAHVKTDQQLIRPHSTSTTVTGIRYRFGS